MLLNHTLYNSDPSLYYWYKSYLRGVWTQGHASTDPPYDTDITQITVYITKSLIISLFILLNHFLHDCYKWYLRGVLPRYTKDMWTQGHASTDPPLWYTYTTHIAPYTRTPFALLLCNSYCEHKWTHKCCEHKCSHNKELLLCNAYGEHKVTPPRTPLYIADIQVILPASPICH